jgi:hypothetical protein
MELLFLAEVMLEIKESVIQDCDKMIDRMRAFCDQPKIKVLETFNVLVVFS